MKISVDFSILVHSDTAYGRISGCLNVAALPTHGAIISFQFPIAGELALPENFAAQLRVESVIFLPGDEQESKVIVMLADVVCDSQANAKEVADYITQGFSLVVDEY